MTSGINYSTPTTKSLYALISTCKIYIVISLSVAILIEGVVCPRETTKPLVGTTSNCVSQYDATVLSDTPTLVTHDDTFSSTSPTGERTSPIPYHMHSTEQIHSASSTQFNHQRGESCESPKSAELNASSPIMADIFDKNIFKNNKGLSLLKDNTSAVQLASTQFKKNSALFITGVMDLIYAIYPIISREAQKEFNLNFSQLEESITSDKNLVSIS